MKLITSTIAVIIGFTLSAQTKLISHKSHSGSKKNFHNALFNSNSEMKFSNFGMAPQRMVRNSSLDTVILLSDDIAVMVTSEYCRWEDYGDETRNGGKGNLWSAGKDTVYNHPLFNSKNTVKEMKSKLKGEYFFANSTDSIVFIGFEKSKHFEKDPFAESEKEAENPKKKDYDFPVKRRSFFMVMVLSIISLMTKGSL